MSRKIFKYSSYIALFEGKDLKYILFIVSDTFAIFHKHGINEKINVIGSSLIVKMLPNTTLQNLESIFSM